MKCDCHIHMILDGVYFADAIAQHKGGVREELVRSRLKSYQEAGVTYLRSGGDAWGVCMLARKLAPEYGIEYAAPGFPIHKNGRYGGFIGLGYGSEAEYLALLDRAEAQGADFIKLMLSGIMDFNTYGALSCPPVEAQEMRALIRHAHDRGLRVMAHLNGDEAVRNALDAGVDSIEHGYYMSEDTVARLADSDTVWVPTLSPVLNCIGAGRFDDEVLRRIAARQLQAVSLAASRGAYLALGSDAGAWRVFHGTCVQNEEDALRPVLGAGTELILGLGSARIREKFRRKS